MDSKLTTQEMDLLRWCYVVAGFSRARLANDFEVSIHDVEEIVSQGLGRILNPVAKNSNSADSP
jgi:hypothetical protein